MSDAPVCPRCVEDLEGPREHAESSYWPCRRCGGLLVEGPLTSRAALAEVVALDGTATRKVAGSRPAGPCPRCRVFMTTKILAGGDVTVDVCAQHGVWFDRGELEATVRAGRSGAASRNPIAGAPPKRSPSPPPRRWVAPGEAGNEGILGGLELVGAVFEVLSIFVDDD